jgi:hypothetical protein
MSVEHPPRIALPPITYLPPPGAQPRSPGIRAEPNVVRVLAATGVRSWASEPVALSPETTTVAWVVLAVNLALVGWLIAVRSGALACSGLPCTVATLGGHAAWQLALAACCVAALAGCVPITRGLSRANAAQLGLITAGVLGGVVAVVGFVVLAIAVVSAVVAAGFVFVLLVDRL